LNKAVEVAGNKNAPQVPKSDFPKLTGRAAAWRTPVASGEDRQAGIALKRWGGRVEMSFPRKSAN
jgi:hypothetical protein